MNPQEDSAQNVAESQVKGYKDIKVFVPLDLKRPPNKKKPDTLIQQPKENCQKAAQNVPQNKLEVYGNLQQKGKSEHRFPPRTSSRNGKYFHFIYLARVRYNKDIKDPLAGFKTIDKSSQQFISNMESVAESLEKHSKDEEQLSLKQDSPRI